jgi:hypothetical protein
MRYMGEVKEHAPYGMLYRMCATDLELTRRYEANMCMLDYGTFGDLGGNRHVVLLMLDKV